MRGKTQKFGLLLGTFILTGLTHSCKTSLEEDSLLRAADTPEVALYKSLKPRTCESSESSMFKNSIAEVAKPITIKGDIDAIFRSHKPNYAVILNPNSKDDESKFIPVFIENRGNSRASYCEIKPVRIKFMLQPADPKLISKLAKREDDWKKVGISHEAHQKIISGFAAGMSDSEKLQAYYNAFIESQPKDNTAGVGFAQAKDSFFGQMGNDVKFVTHCGKPSGFPVLGGPNYEVQREHLLNEFYIYRIINEFKTTIIKSSLLEVTYELANAPGNAVSFDGTTKVLGFLRESKTRLADRCDLLTRHEQGVREDNAISRVQSDFINNLFVSLDYGLDFEHNTELLYDAEGRSVYSTYDFDLSGIWTEEYGKNPGPIEDQAVRFRDSFLASYIGNETMISQVLFIIGKMAKIKAKIEVAEKTINPRASASKKKFVRWIEAFEPVLVDFIAKNEATHGAFIAAVKAHQVKNKRKDDAPEPEK